ncbi:MAG: hypothetical protein ACRCVA_11765 [Phreatobacter sp.]
MNKRAVVIGAGVVSLCLLAGLVAIWPVAGMFLHVISESLAPQTISWRAKNAWAKCDGAIAGSVSWPEQPAPACAAMHLCTNEAGLNPSQNAALAMAIRRLPGCSEP